MYSWIRRRMKKTVVFLCLFCMFLSCSPFTFAAVNMVGSQSQNEGINVLPAPGPVTIDGDLTEWDWSGRIWAFSNEAIRDRYSAQVAAMWDSQNLYVAVKWKDPTPMYSTVDPLVEPTFGWQSDALQLRFRTDKISHVTTWYYAPRDEAVVDIQYGKSMTEPFGGSGGFTVQGPSGADIGHGLQIFYKPDADGIGYVQEMKIPWSSVYNNVPVFKNGDAFQLGMEFLWGDTAGKGTPFHRYADNMQPGVTTRSFYFKDFTAWGNAVISDHGNVPVRQYISDINAKPEGTIPVRATIPADASKFTIAINDAAGNRIRNLAGDFDTQLYTVSTQGNQRVIEVLWDGLDDAGKLVQPGPYQVVGLTHNGVGADYERSVYNPGSPTWNTSDGKGGWGADHSAPYKVEASGDKMMAGWYFNESGSGLIGVGADGLKKWGQWNGIAAMAADDQIVYTVPNDWTDTTTRNKLVRYNANDGSASYFVLNGKNRPFKVTFTDIFGAAAAQIGEATDMAAYDGKLVMAMSSGKLAVLNSVSAELLKLIDAPNPTGVAFDRQNGTLYAIIGGVVQRVDLNTGSLSPLALPGIGVAGAIDIDNTGHIVVADTGPDSQMKAFTADGVLAYTAGKKGGRPLSGAFDNQAMVRMSSVAVDAQNQIWVTESWENPRRISVWGQDGKLIREYLGNPYYKGSGGSLDDLDPTVAYYQAVKMKLNPDDRSWNVSDILWVPDPQQNEAFPVESDWDSNPIAFHSNASGQDKQYIYLSTNKSNNGSPYGSSVLYMQRGTSWQPVTAFTNVNALTRQLPNLDFSGHALSDGVIWNDLNKDGKVSLDECTFVSGGIPYVGFWGTRPGSDLSLYFNGITSFRPIRYSDDGAPVYGMENMVKSSINELGDLVPVSEENKLLLLSNKNSGKKYPDPTNKIFGIATDADKIVWSYPNPYPSVAGSHSAPIAKPGEIFGPLKITGVAEVNSEAGRVFGIRSNMGREYFMTTDGLFVGALFVDSRLPSAPLPSMEAELVGHPMDDISLGDEPFSGWFGKQSDGKYRMTVGLNGPNISILQVKGLDTIKRFTTPAIVLDAAAIDRAYQDILARAHQAGTKKEYDILGLQQAPTIDGDPADWQNVKEMPIELAGSPNKGWVKIGYDQERLYTLFEVTDSSPWLNNGVDFTQLFKTGDAVDLQFNIDPSTQDPRTNVLAGDVRLLFSKFNGNPVAMLMKPIDPDAPNNLKVTYSSPVMNKTFDRVELISDAQVAVKVDSTKQKYWVEASVPLSKLGFHPATGTKIRGDAGIIFSDAAGLTDAARIYWSNQQTNLVSDLPSEAWLYPASWGEWNFPGDAPKKPTGDFQINGGARFTNTQSVTVSLNAIDGVGNPVSQMRFSSDGTTWGSWVAYSSSIPYSLAAGDGVKKVYVQFKDISGILSDIYNQDIVLDTVPPTGYVNINCGNSPTSVTLSVYATDANGLAQMQFSTDGQTWSDWEAYATSKNYTLPAGYPKTVYVRFKDTAGNVSAPFSDVTTIAESQASCVAAEPVSFSKIQLSWTNATQTDVDGYKIERKTGTDPYAEIATVLSNLNLYQDTGLIPGTLYSYRVRAFRGTQMFDYSHSALATTYPSSGGLSLYYTFDENSGNVIDHSGNGYTGTAFSTAYVPNGGLVGGALSFDGRQSYVDSGYGPGSQDNLTVSFWMKASSLGYFEPINKMPSDSSGKGWAVKLRNNGDIWFTVGSEKNNSNNAVLASSAYSVGQWVNVTCTFSNGTAKIYINGQLKAAKTVTQQTGNVTGKFRLGLYSDFTGFMFRGLMDETKIFDKALTDQEVLDNYNQLFETIVTTASVSPAQPNGQNGWYVSPVTASLVATDLSSGVAKTEYSLDNGNTWKLYSVPILFDQDNKYILSYRSTNTAGIVETPKNLNVNVDATAPITTASVSPAQPDGPNGWYMHPVTVTLAAYDNLSGVASSEYSLDGGTTWQPYTVPVAFDKNGMYTLSYRSRDKAGNLETSKNISFNIHVTVPVTAVSVSPSQPDGLNGWYVHPVTVTLTAPDNMSTEYSLDGGTTWQKYTAPLTLDRDGQNVLNYRSKDNAGNVEAVRTLTANVDQTAPVTSDNAPTSWVNQDVTVNLTASDSGSGVAATNYTVDGGAQQTGNAVSLTTDGVHTLVYWSVDTAGNIEAKHTVTVKIDKTAPVTSIQINGGARITNTQSVTVSLNAKDGAGNPMSQMRFSSDGKTWGSWVAYSSSIPYSLAAGDGVKKVYVQFKDISGILSDVYSRDIVLDTVPPTGYVNINCGNSPTSVTLSVYATDANGVAQMQFSTDGQSWSDWEAYATSKNYNLPAGYPKTVYVRFKDTAGNVSAPFSDVTTIAESQASCVAAEPVSFSKIQLSWTNATQTGVDGYKIERKTGTDPYAEIATVLSPNLNLYQDAGLIPGTLYSYRVRAFRGTQMFDYSHSALATTYPSSGGLSLYYTFDESGGNVIDHSGNGYTGTAFSTAYVPNGGLVGGALSFDGRQSYVDSGYGPGSQDNLTVSFWMKANALGYLEPINKMPSDSSGKGWAVKLRNNGDIWFAVGSEKNNSSNAVLASSAYSVGQWVNVTCTFSNGTAKIYINGQLKAAKTVTQQTGNVTGKFRLGLYSDFTGFMFRGLLDEVRVFDKAMTDQEVLDNYNQFATIVTTASVSPAQPNGQNGWYVSPVTASLAATDLSSGVTKTEYSLDNGNTWKLYSVPILFAQDNKYILSYRSTNTAGFVETPKNLNVNVDATAPVTTASVSPAQPDGPNGWYVHPVTVTLAASDNLSGIASSEYSLDGGTTWQPYTVPVTFDKNGMYTLSYRSRDKAGNLETSKNISFNIHVTVPVTTVSVSPAQQDGLNGWYVHPVTVTLAAPDNMSTEYSLDGGTTWQMYTAPLTLDRDGQNVLNYRSKDSAGNVEAVNTWTANVDQTAPVTSDNAPASWVNQDVTVNLTASDSGSGVAATNYTVDGGAQQTGTAVELTTDGVHTLAYWSVDHAGNIEAAHTATVKIDKTAPVSVASVSPAVPNGSNEWYTSDVTVSFSASDNLSGVAKTEYQVNNGAWVTYTGSIPAFGEGNYTIAYRSIDQAGNVEQTQTIAFKIDKTAPALTVQLDKTSLWPANHQMVTINATLTSSDATSGVESVVLTSITSNEPDSDQGDIQANIGTAATSFSLRAERLGSGTGRMYTITYTATDKAGNKTDKSATVTVPHDQS